MSTSFPVYLKMYADNSFGLDLEVVAGGKASDNELATSDSKAHQNPSAFQPRGSVHAFSVAAEAAM